MIKQRFANLLKSLYFTDYYITFKNVICEYLNRKKYMLDHNGSLYRIEKTNNTYYLYNKLNEQKFQYKYKKDLIITLRDNEIFFYGNKKKYCLNCKNQNIKIIKINNLLKIFINKTHHFTLYYTWHYIHQFFFYQVSLKFQIFDYKFYNNFSKYGSEYKYKYNNIFIKKCSNFRRQSEGELITNYKLFFIFI